MKTILFILCLLIGLNVFAQQKEYTATTTSSIVDKPKKKKQSVLIGIGKPLFDEVISREKNFSISAHYQYRILDGIAVEAFYVYGQSDSYPSFFEDKQRLDQYLQSQKFDSIHFNSQWDSVYHHSLGIKVHYSFLDSKNLFFSLYGTFGGYSNKTSLHSVIYWQYDALTGEILNYTNQLSENSISDSFYGIGLQLHIRVFKNYSVGFDASLFSTPEGRVSRVITTPSSDHYHVALIFGMKF